MDAAWNRATITAKAQAIVGSRPSVSYPSAVSAQYVRTVLAELLTLVGASGGEQHKGCFCRYCNPQSEPEGERWLLFKADRLLYASHGKDIVWCDRGHSSDVTIAVKLGPEGLKKLREAINSNESPTGFDPHDSKEEAQQQPPQGNNT